MKNKLFIALLTTALLLSACGGKQADAQPEVNVGTETDALQNEQGESKELTWVRLYDLDTYNDTLRVPMEQAANTGYYADPTIKEGVFYQNAEVEGAKIDKNNTLMNVLYKGYRKSESLSKLETITAFSKAALNTYADLDTEDEMTNYYMALNGYFNILPDAEPNYCNPDSLVTRAEFLSAVYRAETPVNEDLEVREEFETAVGESEYNLYAQSLAHHGYLTTSDKSLNSKTYNGVISRGEAIYFLMNHYYGTKLAEVDTEGVTLEDVSDGGDISSELGFTDKEYGKSYELAYILENPTEVSTPLFKSLVMAEQMGFIDSETRHEEGLTKAEAIELIVKIYKELDMQKSVMDRYQNTEENKDDIEEVTTKEPNSQGFIIMDEDTDGDGILSYDEATADGMKYYKLCYNDDGSNTTYLVDIKTGDIIHPGQWFTNHNGQREIWCGTTPEDHAMVDNQ